MVLVVAALLAGVAGAVEPEGGVLVVPPGVKTEILAYLFQSAVPKCRISPNVAWTYCPYHARWSYNAPMFHPVSNNIFNNFTAMQEKGGEMHVYDYHAFSPPLNSAFTAMAEASAADYGWYADHGAKMTGAEFVGSIAAEATRGGRVNLA